MNPIANPVLVLREEIVCLVLLIYLAFVSRSFRMGKDGKIFNQIMTFAMVHLIMDGFTVWTVNHKDTTPLVNDAAHIVFFLSAILFSAEIFIYIVNLCYPNLKKPMQVRLITEAPVLVYALLVVTGVLKINYDEFFGGSALLGGTYASTGPAPTAGFALCFVYFLVAIVLLLYNGKRIGKHIRLMLLPMLFLLIAVELVQMLMKEFLFTGATITVITVGFFFSLENPAAVLERKVMMDALSGLGSRASYEADIARYDEDFQKDRTIPFTFVFADISNLRSVNGMFGHQVGDAYISEMAVLLMTNMRNADRIYRMGGDEFLAIYRKTDEKVVIRDIRRVHDACERHGEGKEYVPELAIGYAISDEKYDSLRNVLRVADYMMYRNKAEIKREVAVGALHETGTRLNLSGLTDRVFDAMCQTSDNLYPYICNMETNITRVSPGMVDFFGLPGEFMSDFMSIWMERIHPADQDGYEQDLRAAMKGIKEYHFYKYRVRGKDGKYLEVTCRGGLYHGKSGEPDIFSGYIVNHGVPKTRDDTTGLMNEVILYDRVEDAVLRDTKAIVMRVAPRTINRIRMLYGEETAAASIRALADLCRQTVSGRGEVFSPDGRSFAFFLPDCEHKQADEIFCRIREACKGGLIIGELLVPLDVCAGAVALPNAGMKGVDAVRSAVLFTSEEARYNQRENVVFYHDDTADINEGEVHLLQTIHHDCVMDRTRFFLRFQPIIDAQNGKVTGAEALLRYESEEFGEIPPGRFISFLESDPGYTELGYDIIRNAIQNAQNFRADLPDFNINVNITALQLYADSFVPQVQKILEEEKFPAEHLILELTERCKEMDFDFLKQRVEELRRAGIRVALDDMGTGFSTIDLLLHLPVNEIKLDMVFTQGMRNSEKDIRFAKLLAQIAEQNDMLLCFEGVETKELKDYLTGFGKVILQGYYFDKPLKANEFSEKYCPLKREVWTEPE